MKMDRIVTSAPVNRTSAQVVARGEHWEPRKKLVHSWDYSSDLPLPVAPFPGPEEADMTGLKVGRLAVVGYAEVQSNRHVGGATWVVRCSCGRFERRKTRTLKKSVPARLMCVQCDYLDQMKKGQHSPSIGAVHGSTREAS